MAYIVQCTPEAAKILFQYGAEKDKRNSISVLDELLCTLDSRLFSAGASRILVHALHATRLGRTKISHAMDLFPWLCNFCDFFARLIGLKTLCSSVGDFGGSSSWSILNQLSCIFNVVTEFLTLFASAWLFINLMVHPSTLFFLSNSQEDGVVQWPFRAALRLRLFSKLTSSSVLPLEPFLQSFPFSVSLKLAASRLVNSLNTLLLEQR